jgi:endonuclease/exonuclease/phosphatase family metal-dependent hydrolase
MDFKEAKNKDPIEYYADLNGGSQLNFIKNNDISNDKYIYPSQVELLKLGYEPNIIIYSDDKPYLYPGEHFEFNAVAKYCNRKIDEIKDKRSALRIATFNLHNFITRCNQGLAPLFGTALNPFSKPKDINKFIDLFKKVNADIYCFQEFVPITEKYIDKDITDLEYVRKNFNFKYFNDLMENIGYKYKIIGPTQYGKFYDLENRSYYFLANAIYSKIELLNPEVYSFSYLNRNIITAEVLFNNTKIRIFNTHLEYFETNNQILQNLNITTNQVIQQFKDLENLIDNFKNNNTIICGDFNIDIFNKNIGNRYRNWEEKTSFLRNNYLNVNRIQIPTNFSQQEKTDFIIINKNSSLKTVYSYTVFTSISDHYMVFADFIN